MSEVNVGLLVRIEALAGKEDEVAAFLAGALPLALDEPATTAWFAIRIGPSTFGVFDVFAGEEGREAHLAGQIAAALIGSMLARSSKRPPSRRSTSSRPSSSARAGDLRASRAMIRDDVSARQQPTLPSVPVPISRLGR